MLQFSLHQTGHLLFPSLSYHIMLSSPDLYPFHMVFILLIFSLLCLLKGPFTDKHLFILLVDSMVCRGI